MWKPLALGLFLVLLAGCGGSPSADITTLMLQAVEDIQTAALTLADEAESLIGDLTTLNLAQAESRERAFTVVGDREETVVIASLKTRSWPPDGEIFGQPMNITIKCTSSRPRKCAGRIPVPQNQEQMRWYGARTVDGRQHEDVALEITQTPATNPIAKQKWSYNKIGLAGPWADAMYCRPCDPTADPVEYHLRYPLPSIPGEELTRTLDLSPLGIVIRTKSGLATPYPLEDPPLALLRDGIALVFYPYKNPEVAQARSIKEVLGKPLGVVYLQISSGPKFTKADAARFMNAQLEREETGGFYLKLTNLKNPGDVLKLRVRETQWCDGCFGQDPPPRHIGIEDQLNDTPLISLQVGPLLLEIEQKDVR